MSDGSAYDDPADVDAADGEPPTTEPGYDPSYLGGGARRRRRSAASPAAWPVIVALVVVLGGAYFVGTKGFHYLKDHLSHSADYSGPGHGKVLFEVKQGDTTSDDRPRPQGEGRGRVGGRLHRRLEQQEHASRSASTS